jgi:release factor glutamine methyltransferase
VKVAAAIRQAAERLSETSDTARLDAELLMAHALGVNRSDMLLRYQDDEVPQDFERLIARRARHEPVAYILEEAEFYGRSLYVNSSVLIPRGDRETIIETALKSAPAYGRVLDMGTGSGALLLTILAERTEMEGIGIDASIDAVQVAALNARRLGLGDRARMLKRDWHDAGWADDLGRFELILCNPPYVEESAVLAPDVRDFEPAGALFSGPEGLDDYRAIIPQLAELLAPDGVAILEIGHQQAENVTEIAKRWGFKLEVLTDLGGRSRAVILWN